MSRNEMSVPRSVQEAVHACAVRATQGSAALARASDVEIDTALRAMAERLLTARDVVTAANQDDLRSAASNGMSAALQDRLRLTGPRFEDMAAALRTLADVPHEPRDSVLEERPDGLVLLERRRPVGVIGANFEARPNVTLDVASQFLKSRNGGVLRTGSAALRSSQALVTHVITPALTDAGLNPDAIQLVPSEDRAAAHALVSLPETVPLVILRGSGDSTRELGREAARHGVRTLAHADGGGVLYVARDADEKLVHELVVSSLDRLGVCNRLNLLLIDRAVHDKLLPGILKTLEDLGIAASLPPHAHARGYEWSLDSEHAATVTIDEADGPVQAARIANEETSGLAAAIATHDPDTADRFMDAYGGSGVFWNSTTRLLDGFKLLRLPETGINIDRVPGPRGPVTYRDLYLRQYVVRPAASLRR
ncbi:aldehyde dehydrogenase family protein [Streptomyces sp. SP18BB07]|uniref:aldehyde dehydrogenase family protein n=1 Tax=Streptomyces sp. SP18BB07 TaxID=3002522 RepID=UPI002E7A0BCB|nr:aldehyde dehydrogenase family protein [Streptomyces sp. SP18BB07]MEE1759251.1 aldehyde dehydrogenase family protein [Streptomyces sp. SP18BB07]